MSIFPTPPDWRAALGELEGVFAPRTLENCIGVFSGFEAWCVARDASAAPASPETLAAYVGDIFGLVAASTVRTRLIEIRRVHEALGYADPTHSDLVQLAYRRGARRYGTVVRQREGLNAPLKDRLVARCAESLLGRRDRAMITVGYDLLTRASELVALRIEDLHPQSDGAAYLLVPCLKTDPGGRPKPSYLSPATYQVLQRWLDDVGEPSGPLLRPIQGGRIVPRPISPQTINHRLRVLAREEGFDEAFISNLSSHSLRIGAAQDLASTGRTLLEIMLAGRWRDLSSVVGYTRDAQVNVWAPGDGDAWAHLAGIEARVRKGVHGHGVATPSAASMPQFSR